MKRAVFAVLLSVQSVLAAAQAASCESLASLNLPNVFVSVAESRSAGEFPVPGAKPIADLPPFCRVAGSIKPSSDSDIRFEVWLPISNWNNKFQGIGNGGYAGSIGYSGLADAVRHGYATASTDTGHADKGESARWALHHPEKLIDFGFRAIHETAVGSKAIIRAFYGDLPKRSYFNSCSNGGRQALMEAQRYPADYDGIIAGAPANNWTHLLSSAAFGTNVLMGDAASFIPAAKLPAIEAAALTQCDALDGVQDRVIDNPLVCHFDPSVLLCKGEESAACLTAAQIHSLKAIYGGLKDKAGKQLLPGLSPGGEAEAGGWANWVTGDAPGKSSMFAYGTQFFANILYANPDWDFHTFNVERDVKAADERVGKYLNATDADLSAFQQRGGKLIIFHGWSDAAIPALNAIDYFNSVVAKMGSDRASEFVRLYMVPGMEHCGGGAGPNNFGQFGTPSGDRFHNVDSAIEAWVEQGTAPDAIVATKYRDNETRKGVERTRPLCVWPQVAKYKGTGSTDDAANFVCGR